MYKYQVYEYSQRKRTKMELSFGKIKCTRPAKTDYSGGKGDTPYTAEKIFPRIPYVLVIVYTCPQLYL